MHAIAIIMLHLKVIHSKVTIGHEENYLSFINIMEIDNLFFALGNGSLDAFSTMMRVSAIGLEVGFAKGREVDPAVGSAIACSVGRGPGKGVGTGFGLFIVGKGVGSGAGQGAGSKETT